MSLIFSNGADVNAVSNTGDTPLHDAVRRGCEKVIILFSIISLEAAFISLLFICYNSMFYIFYWPTDDFNLLVGLAFITFWS